MPEAIELAAETGMGYFSQVVEAALPGAKIRWHGSPALFRGARPSSKGVPIAVVSAWLGHSDINLTVKRYGKWSSTAREPWRWAKAMSEPTDAVGQRPALGVLDGGRENDLPR
jgi:hypothetical protein